MAGDDLKRAAGFAAVDRFVRDGMCIGLGTGSTAYWAIERVGERVAAGETFVAVPTSVATEERCRAYGIRLAGLGACEIAVAIDGADEVAADLSLTKGGGGAMFREKAVALVACTFVVIVTPEKLVTKLGAFPTALEVVPFSERYVTSEIARAFGVPAVQRRLRGGAPFVSDNGNTVVDCGFGTIDDPGALDASLREIHGVVSTGIFVGLTSVVLVGAGDGVRELRPG